MKKRTPVEVRAYSGYRGEESPRAFRYEGTEHEVARILTASTEREINGRWIRRFRVETDSGQQCTLVYDEKERGWFLEC